MDIPTLCIEQQVLGLDITMNHVLGVKITERISHLSNVLQGNCVSAVGGTEPLIELVTAGLTRLLRLSSNLPSRWRCLNSSPLLANSRARMIRLLSWK
jgi:hypothetical protein